MIEIFEHANGFGYHVAGVYQEYDPECEGFVPMTRERAQECAEAVLSRIQGV